jgi:hypothetical protein
MVEQAVILVKTSSAVEIPARIRPAGKPRLSSQQPSRNADNQLILPADVLHLRQEEFIQKNYKTKTPKPIATSEQEGIYVNNAGLVLLHPFFHTYFTRLQLITNGKFNDTVAQQRAVHLLQLLVYGNSEQPEHALVLNKILCNFPMEMPLEPTQFTEEERQLSLQLIGAATQQWEKMKNTSVEGFRASFLQRDGVLWQADGAWYLKVKSRSYDIILQTLPWSMGMIKPSWADKILYTEWIFS